MRWKKPPPVPDWSEIWAIRVHVCGVCRDRLWLTKVFHRNRSNCFCGPGAAHWSHCPECHAVYLLNRTKGEEPDFYPLRGFAQTIVLQEVKNR